MITAVAIGHFRVFFASVSKRVHVRHLSYDNQFSSQVHSDANLTHFHMKGFALGLALKPRKKATWKWPVKTFTSSDGSFLTPKGCANTSKHFCRHHSFLPGDRADKQGIYEGHFCHTCPTGTFDYFCPIHTHNGTTLTVLNWRHIFTVFMNTLSQVRMCLFLSGSSAT